MTALILEAINTNGDTAYGEYAAIRHDAIKLAQFLAKRQRQALKLTDGSLIERLNGHNSFDIKITGPEERDDFSSRTYREYTYVYLYENGKVSLSHADGEELYEVQIGPNGKITYSNGRCMDFFPRQEVERVLRCALRAAA